MPLFVCQRCNAVENTALVLSFWSGFCNTSAGPPPEALCSECSEGEWHGMFEKQTYDPTVHKVHYIGFKDVTEKGQPT